MPLVTSKEMFEKAYNGGYAIGAFNVNNMEIVQGITEAAADLKAPLILQVSKGARSCDKEHEVFNIFRLTSETFSKLWVLSCNTHWTGIALADSHHYTAHCYQWSCCKSEFLCTKDCSDGHISSAHKLSICLDNNLISESILNKCLMCFCKTHFPWKSGVMD